MSLPLNFSDYAYLSSDTGTVYGLTKQGKDAECTDESLKGLPTTLLRLEQTEDRRLCLVYPQGGLQLSVSLLQQPQTRFYVWNHESGHDVRVLWRDKKHGLVILPIKDSVPGAPKRFRMTDENATPLLHEIMPDLANVGETQVTFATLSRPFLLSEIRLNQNFISEMVDRQVSEFAGTLLWRDAQRSVKGNVSLQ